MTRITATLTTILLTMACLDEPVFEPNAAIQCSVRQPQSELPPPSASNLGVEDIVSGAGQFPVIGRLGEVLFVVFRGKGGHIGLSGRLDIVRSVDGGRVWQERAIAVDGPLDDRNPAFGGTSNGALLLAFAELDAFDSTGKFVPAQARFTPFLVRSNDSGKTWSPRAVLNIAPFEWASPYGRIVRHGQEMMMAMYGGYYPVYDDEKKPFERQGFFAFVLKSNDEGQSWSQPEIIRRGASEAAVIDLGRGEQLAAVRNDRSQSMILLRRSGNGRWGMDCPISETGEVPGDLRMLSDGRLLLTYARRRPEFSIRARLSSDSGRSWGPPIVVVPEGSVVDFGYPSTVVRGDTILAAYYAEYAAPSSVRGVFARIARYLPGPRE